MAGHATMGGNDVGGLGGGPSTGDSLAPLTGDGSVGDPYTTEDATVASLLGATAAGPLTLLDVATIMTMLGLPNFGANTAVDLANATPAFVRALNLILTLSTTTPGSEVSQWLIQLKRAGVMQNSYLLTPNGPTFDIGSVNDWTETFKINNIIYATIKVLAASGGFVFDTLTAAGAVTMRNQGVDVCKFNDGNKSGLVMGAVPFVEHQWTATAAANNLTLPLNGSGGELTVGVGQVNLINYANASSISMFGRDTWLINTGGAVTYKHNFAPTGTFAPMIMKLGVDLVAAANTYVAFRLVVLGGLHYWYQV